METLSRFFKPPQESYFLFGPRGTGKSTWTRLQYPEALRFDLLAPDVFRSLNARPERLRELIEGNSEKRVIVLDEIQKIPTLLTVVHQMIEEKRGYQFILTGSSARKLKRTGVDLLAGRVLVRTMHPFMARELEARFHFQDALKRGLVPLVMNSSKPEDVLEAYVTLYLREEVQMEGLVRNIGNFSRFLEAASFSHGSPLNVSNVARECEVERKVVEGYLSILEDLLLAFRIPVFNKRAKRALSTHPKFYFFDTGAFRTLRPSGPLDRPEEIEGGALEGLVAQHLRAWLAYRGEEKSELYFWRSRSGLEVDLVVYGPEIFWAVEVKNTARIRPEDLRGLKAFREDYPQAQALFLYRGKERIKQKGTLCLPCEEFLRGLHPAHSLAG